MRAGKEDRIGGGGQASARKALENKGSVGSVPTAIFAAIRGGRCGGGLKNKGSVGSVPAKVAGRDVGVSLLTGGS